MIVPSRRGFLSGLIGGVICAPAIVRASSLMQIKSSLIEPSLPIFSALGLREDLEDVIYRISPANTPFLNAFRARTMFHEWQTESLAVAR